MKKGGTKQHDEWEVWGQEIMHAERKFVSDGNLVILVRVRLFVLLPVGVRAFVVAGPARV